MVNIVSFLSSDKVFYLKRERLDFALDPHLHTSHEVIDVLIYLPENKKYSFNGTSKFNKEKRKYLFFGSVFNKELIKNLNYRDEWFKY
tara:strand:- start:647 stop:910 length:264 start_codon:yes stop_codon:yes gene_type:complete